MTLKILYFTLFSFQTDSCQHLKIGLNIVDSNIINYEKVNTDSRYETFYYKRIKSNWESHSEIYHKSIQKLFVNSDSIIIVYDLEIEKAVVFDFENKKIKRVTFGDHIIKICNVNFFHGQVFNSLKNLYEIDAHIKTPFLGLVHSENDVNDYYLEVFSEKRTDIYFISNEGLQYMLYQLGFNEKDRLSEWEMIDSFLKE